jgi:hypothetical protein
MKLLRALLESDVHKIFEEYAKSFTWQGRNFEIFKNPDSSDFGYFKKEGFNDARFIVDWQNNDLYVFEPNCYHENAARALGFIYPNLNTVVLDYIYGETTIRYPKSFIMSHSSIFRRSLDIASFQEKTIVAQKIMELINTGKFEYLKQWFGESFNNYFLKVVREVHAGDFSN